MCERVVCGECGLFTYWGCGLHIKQVLKNLSEDQICVCEDASEDSEEVPAR